MRYYIVLGKQFGGDQFCSILGEDLVKRGVRHGYIHRILGALWGKCENNQLVTSGSVEYLDEKQSEKCIARLKEETEKEYLDDVRAALDEAAKEEFKTAEVQDFEDELVIRLKRRKREE